MGIIIITIQGFTFDLPLGVVKLFALHLFYFR
jgi:hypothetical protein